MSAPVVSPLSQPTPTSYIPPAQPTPQGPQGYYAPPSPWTPSTTPSAFTPAPQNPQQTAITPDRTASTFKLLNRMSLMSIDALNWAERKTREASERHLEKQMARHEASGMPVQRVAQDPREPRYLQERRVRFEDRTPWEGGFVRGGKQ